MSPQHSILIDKLKSILGVTLFWLVLAMYQYADRWATLYNFDNLPDDYNHWYYLKNLLISVSLGGLVVGTGLVFVWEKWLRKLSFWKAITYIVLFYTGFFIIIMMLSTLTFARNDPWIIEQDSLFSTVANTLFSIGVLPNYLFWLFVSLLSVSFFLVRDNFGSKTFTSFMLGRYFRPKRVERIFMFMDLKSSTTIAEKLGEEQYFRFLNDTFKRSTPPILATKGEIYQYVGDEITVSWTLKDGFHKANCVRAYFGVKKSLEDHSEYFTKTYGVNPIFKAGLHYGHVVAGEIGIVKRAIVYSGDVLNTAARIQSLCNEMNAEILLSSKLASQLDLSIMNRNVKPIGKIHLRGKVENTELVTLTD